MRNLFALAALLICCSTRLSAQLENPNPVDAKRVDTFKHIVKPSRDFLMLQFGYTNFANIPDSVKTKPFSYKFGAFLCYDFPIKKTKLSFAAGLGVSTTSIYLDNQIFSLDDTGVLGNSARVLNDSISNYKRYKFNTAYITAPFELRYFANSLNRNKGFKAAIGLQVGTLLGAHSKGLRSVNGTNIKEKENTKRYVTPWDFATTARVGWGNFAIFGSYNLTNVFKDNAGPAITPFSVGLTVTGL